VVAQLQAAFLMDREVETRERLDDPTLFPPLARVGSSPAQVLSSGPGYATENQRGFFVTLLYAAQRRVVLTTPYFVPDDIFIEAMCDTARRGVQVDLVVSLHNNQRFAQLAEQSYYSELLAAGVRIHRHRPRFLHAKQLMVDTSVAVVGSANLDIRSFALNEELSLIIYDHPTVTMLTDLADGYIADSDTVTTRSWSRQPPQRRFVQNLCRLGNSLL
jgi:cardiolipin synthase